MPDRPLDNRAVRDHEAGLQCEWSQPFCGEQTGRQLDAGVRQRDFHEDALPPPRFVIDRLLPAWAEKAR